MKVLARPWRVVAASVLLLVVPCVAGCLEFDGQEITLRHDAAKDRLDLLLVYRGLYANRSLAGDVEQLQKALQTGEFAFHSNWPVKIDLTTAKGPAAALARHVAVENGPLFTTPTGELCACQFVRVEDLKGLVDMLNDLIAVFVSTQVLGQKLGPAPGREVDEETADLLQDVARGRQRVLRVEGAAIVVSVPCSDADHLWLLQQVLPRFTSQLGAEIVGHLLPEPPVETDLTSTARYPQNPSPEGTTGALTIADLQRELRAAPTSLLAFENHWSLRRTEGLTEFTLGLLYRDECTFTKARAGRYQPNLLPVLKERQIPVEAGLPDQELRRRFDAFCTREPVLPEALAELRRRR